MCATALTIPNIKKKSYRYILEYDHFAKTIWNFKTKICISGKFNLMCIFKTIINTLSIT